MEEIWKPVVGYEGLYEVSNFGAVRNVRRKHNIKLRINSGGYYHVYLNRDGIMKTVSVHRLVAMAFIPNPENKPCVDHINTNKQDNSVTNLRWVTHKENMNNPNTINNFKNPNYNGYYNESKRLSCKKYCDSHKEQIAEYGKRWREENKEHIKEVSKEYADKNKERISEYHKIWYQKNRERVREQHKKWNDSHKEYRKEYYNKHKK